MISPVVELLTGISNMLSLLNKLYPTIKVWMFGTLLVSVAAFLWQYHSLSLDYEITKSKVSQQGVVIAEQSAVIDNLKSDIEFRQKIVNKTSKTFQNVSEIEKSTNRKLEKKRNGNDRDISEIIIRHPSMFDDIINKATSDNFRCFELSSGSIPTEKDNTDGNYQCPLLTKKHSPSN
jgi:hypothetical protein